MLRIFRHKRERSLSGNPNGQAGQTRKFGRYLLYAIGEIVLIVLGILIALYLDDLQAARQAREVETKMLEELASDLQSNIEILERTLKTEQEYLGYNEMILEYLDERKPRDQSLDRAFGVCFWTISTNPVTGGYEYLKSKGIDLITNDSLRDKISFIFENSFSIIKNENEVWSNNLQQNISYPYHVTHFMRYYEEGPGGSEVEMARPFDYEALLGDWEFRSINMEIISNRKWNINSLQELIADIKVLIRQIDRELRELSPKE